MKIYWSIIRKDACRVWLPWLLWLTLAVLELVVGRGFLRSTELTLATQYELDAYLVPLNGLLMLLEFVLAAWLVMLDSPSNPDAEWMTRPLSGLQLFGAKLLGVALLLWLPDLLLDLAWWSAHGLRPAEMAAAAVSCLPITVSITLAAMLLASLSADWARLLAYTVAAVLFGSLLCWSLPVVPTLRRYDQGAYFVPYALMAKLALLPLACAAAAASQYRTRRAGRTLGIAVSGLLAVLVLTTPVKAPAEFPWISGNIESVPEHSEPLPPSIQVTFGRLGSYYNPFHTPRFLANAPRQVRWPIGLGLGLDGLQPGELVLPGLLDSVLSLPGRPSLQLTWNSFNPDDPADYLKAILGRRPDPHRTGMRGYPLRSIAARLMGGGASLKGTLYLQRMLAVSEGHIPLQAGVTGSISGARITVLSVNTDDNGSEMQENNRFLASVSVNAIEPLAVLGRNWTEARDREHYVFCNRARAEAVLTTDNEHSQQTIRGIRLRRIQYHAMLPAKLKLLNQDECAAWLAGAELTHVQYVPERIYRTEVNLTDLRLSVTKE